MKKRILMISDTIVMPLERGNRKRVYNLIQMMKDNDCEVDFLYLATYPEEDPTLTEELVGKEHFIRFENRKRTLPVFLKRKVRKVLELLHIPGLFKYFTIDELISPKIGRFIEQLMQERHYDVVWAEYIYTSKALCYVPEGVTKVIDTVNAFSFKRQMYEAVGYYNYEFALKKKEEAKGLMRADWVVAIQEEEEDFFRSILPKDAKVCTIGENMPVTNPYVAQTNHILFLGSYYVVNREGVKHFIQSILPILKESKVPFHFQLAGTICRHIEDSEDYEKLGIVDSVEEVYRNARVVINPVHVGTGLNIKTIEAVSMAKPLVSHSVGVRGLRTDQTFALVSDDDREFAKNIITVLTDEKKAMELSENAACFMQKYIKKNTEALRAILEDTHERI
ncbi:MAG TPA: glycosyltransferase [Lachnospiraceae bacterium]|nr:glycosyltransferase [Lachnospiraceae bacterium]HPF28983.1 glycosyltransferase [Lachnospiraceae bacterium]